VIKPASYWALHKTCDAYTLGRVGATLGGQTVEPPLTVAEAALVSVIRQDSEWMDERMEAQREKWAKAKRERRAKDGAEHNSDVLKCPKDKRGQGKCPQMSEGHARTREESSDVSQCPTMSSSLPPSVPPSVPPTLDNTNVLSASTSDTRTRGDVPGLKDVVSAATSTMGVPGWYARWWYEQMVAYDWSSTKGVRIGHGNWKAMLKAWHNRSLGDAKEYERVRSEYAAKKPKAVKVTAADWGLCAERCSACRDGRCTKGEAVPPQMRPWPITPEECDGFARLG